MVRKQLVWFGFLVVGWLPKPNEIGGADTALMTATWRVWRRAVAFTALEILIGICFSAPRMYSALRG